MCYRNDIITQGDQPSTWCRMTIPGHFPCRKDNASSLLQQILILTMGFPSLRILLPPKPPSTDLQSARSTDGIPHSIASDQETHFTAREVQQWTHDHRIHCSYHAPHHPEAAGLIERWNVILKTQPQSQVGDRSLES